MTVEHLHQDNAVKLDAREGSPAETIFELAHAYLPSCALHVAARLGIADLLADGPRAIDDLARLSHVHAPSLARLLRTLAMYGVFAEDSDGRYRLTPAAELLRTGALRDMVRLSGDLAGDGTWWSAVGRLGDAVVTGRPSRLSRITAGMWLPATSLNRFHPGQMSTCSNGSCMTGTTTAA